MKTQVGESRDGVKANVVAAMSGSTSECIDLVKYAFKAHKSVKLDEGAAALLAEMIRREAKGGGLNCDEDQQDEYEFGEPDGRSRLCSGVLCALVPLVEDEATRSCTGKKSLLDKRTVVTAATLSELKGNGSLECWQNRTKCSEAGKIQIALRSNKTAHCALL